MTGISGAPYHKRTVLPKALTGSLAVDLLTGFAVSAPPEATKAELREITKSHFMRESPVMISSTMPSAKYSCSGSPWQDDN